MELKYVKDKTSLVFQRQDLISFQLSETVNYIYPCTHRYLVFIVYFTEIDFFLFCFLGILWAVWHSKINCMSNLSISKQYLNLNLTFYFPFAMAVYIKFVGLYVHIFQGLLHVSGAPILQLCSCVLYKRNLVQLI